MNGFRTTAARLLATGFGIGRLPWMPGSWGSAIVLPFGALIALSWSHAALFALAAVLLGAGFWATRIHLESTGDDDPPEIVIDEAAGQSLALAFLDVGFLEYALAFALFRITDIFKIWPAGLVERRLPGASGVMLDDLVAGLYAGIGALLLLRVFDPYLPGLADLAGLSA